MSDYHFIHLTLDVMKLLKLEDSFKAQQVTDDKIIKDLENCRLESIIPDENHREQFLNQFDILLDAGDECSTFDEEPSSKIPRMDPPQNGNTPIKNHFVESTPFGNSFTADDSSQISGATPKDLSFDGGSSIGSTARNSPIKPSQNVFEDSILTENEIKPIQILQINKSPVTLDTEALSHIFGKNPNRQIGIICMTGAAKKGKSFFLNYVLRFLKWSAGHDDNKTSTPHDWFDIKFADAPCEGFEWGKNKKTKGVWIWPKPFSFKQGIDGEEIDVFIMDIEGIFSINSTSPVSVLSSKFHLQSASIFESAVLLGFSLLASSFLVLNIEDFCGKNDKSHYFKYFESFISHAQKSIAIDYDPTEFPSSPSKIIPPFQKLLFLIRDWKKPGEFQYGSADGHKYLNKAFIPPEYFSPEDKDAREKFRDFFSHTNAVLLPHPGEESLKPKALGSFQELEKNFSTVLRKSINSKFNPLKKIPAKRFKGNIIKGPELVGMLCHFVNVVNKNPKLLDGKLMDFNIYRKIVNSFDLKKQIKNLANAEVKDLKHIPQQKQDVQQSSLKSSCECLLNSFKHLMTQHFPSDGKTFQSTEEIERLLKFAQDFVHNMSLPLFSTYSDQQIVQEHLNNLSNLIIIEKEKILMENTLRRQEAEKLMRNEIEQLLNSYKSKIASCYLMDKSLVSLKDEDFKKFNDSLKENCLEEFKTKFGDNILFPLASQNLSVEIEALSSDLLLIVGTRRQEQIGRISGARDTAVKTYKDAIIKFYGDSTKKEGNNFFDESILLTKHEEEKSISIGFLSQFFDTFFDRVGNADQLKTIEMEVLSEINQIYELYKLKNEQRKNIFLSQIQNSFYASKECYTYKMKEVINNLISDNNSTSSLDETIFHQNEKVVRIYVLENFNDSIKSKFSNPNPDIVKSFKEQLENYMDKELNEVYLCSFIIKKEEDEFVVRQALFCASLFYNEQMVKHFTNKDSLYIKPKELNSLNEKITAAALQYCQDKNFGAESNNMTDGMRKRQLLTPRQKNELMEALKLVFKKYEEQNLRRLPDKNPSIGIDLGYTNSCVCVYLGGQVTVILNENGKNTTPSYVHFSEDGTIIVGDAAKQLASQHPTSTVYGVKRLIGRKFSQVQDDIQHFPFQVVGIDDVPYVQIRGKNYHAEEISAIILKKLKNIAESYLDMTVENCVITVPAQFNDAMRQATRDAGKIAGLNVLALLNEPTSSAYSYQLHRTDDLKRNVVVFDLGGGTLDVAVLKINKGEIKVETVQGDNHLGGQDFDQKMVEYCVESMKKEHQVVLSNAQLLKLRDQCEEQKKVLSAAKIATASLDLGENKIVSVTFTRGDFEKMNAPQFQKCIEILEKALNEANMKKTEVDDIVLIGGSSRIPEIQKRLIDYFGKTLSTRINADEAVAYGAAFHAALLTGQKMAQSPSQHIVRTVVEVANFNIGVETHNKKLSVVIPKNSVLPCEFVKTYYTIHDNQPRLRFNIYEGEEELAAENNLLGCFRVYDIPTPSEWGRNPIDVTLTLDVEGILTAKAVWREDQNVSSQIKILANKCRMTEKEIEKAKARVDQNFFVRLEPAQ